MEKLLLKNLHLYHFPYNSWIFSIKPNNNPQSEVEGAAAAYGPWHMAARRWRRGDGRCEG
ncbi:hypothetical protein Pint_28662 [Pistacia integerrima]|uniref:Uncharacterized protein n=1 Tax=Pistacia integerrima TaxID=434235 RepID=A0ACC0YSW6_9ROSI|nr:hypothetical protein Pint_28662 [Pistacia integerrima]